MEHLKKIVQEMTLEEKIGQIFLWSHVDADVESGVEAMQPGGLVLFAADVAEMTGDQLREKMARIQSKAKLPLLMCVDEEGGTVVRVSRQPQLREARFKSPMDLKKEGGLELVKQDAVEKCRFLRSFDINVNFAPVADMSDNPEAFIYPRVYGSDAVETAEYTKAVCQIMSEEKVGSSLKHFPGYSDNRDTHKELAFDSRPLSQFENVDLVPFQAGIDGGADSIMVSHTIVECFDAQQPASLSPAVHQYIREKMGFDGILMTDDMNMQAIVKHCNGEDPCVRALMCGNDMLMIQDIASGIQRVRGAVEDGRVSMESLDQSVLRVLKWKQKLGLL